MEKGQVVMVYQDPITRQKPEGKARLVRLEYKNALDGNYECWKVKFADDLGATYTRFIALEDVVTEEAQP